ILRTVNGGGPDQEAGDGFLMRRGYTVAWVGWQYDLADQNQNLRLEAPIAQEHSGANAVEIHGLVRADFTVSQRRDEMPLGHILLGPNGGNSYPVDDPASPQNVLTVRDTRDGARQTITRDQWSFRDARLIRLNGGFVPGKIYEVVYTAKNPAVSGLGLAAVRDFLTYLKHDQQAIAPVQRVYAVGISQSGRFLRHFLY